MSLASQRVAYTRSLSSPVVLRGDSIVRTLPTLFTSGQPQNSAGTTTTPNRSASPPSCQPSHPTYDKVDLVLQCIWEAVRHSSDKDCIVIPGVDGATFAALEEHPERESLPRLSYYEETKELLLKMPSTVHEHLPYFTNTVGPILEAFLLPFGLTALVTNSPSIMLSINGFSVNHEPDKSLRIIQLLEGRRRLWDTPEASILPAIVVEIAHSQSAVSAKKKAWEYLHGSDNQVRLVIILDIRKPSDVKNLSGWKAFIKTWRASPPGGNYDTYYPPNYAGQGLIYSPGTEGTQNILEEALSPDAASLHIRLEDILSQDQRDKIPQLNNTAAAVLPLKLLGDQLYNAIVELITHQK